MSKKTLRDWLREQPFTLALSSGFFGFFAHCGVCSVLEEEGLEPAALTGSSAGALVGGAWASGISPAALQQELFRLQRTDFWDASIGFGLLKGELFRERLERILPVRSFSQCRIPLAVSVFDVRKRSTIVLRDGLLAPAIHAACALPILFQPVRHEGRWLLDGGILDRPGIESLRAGERTLHHHLSGRSPWRSKRDPALVPPQRAGLLSLVLDDLPRTGPFSLEVGKEAFYRAREGTQQALERVVTTQPIRVQVGK